VKVVENRLSSLGQRRPIEELESSDERTDLVRGLDAVKDVFGRQGFDFRALSMISNNDATLGCRGF